MTSPDTARAETIDRFSFMFTDIPPRLCTANDSPTVGHSSNYYPPHPHRDFIIQVNERSGAWNGHTYPPSPPTSDKLSPSTARGYSTIDRSNPYDLYGSPTAESETPSHTPFSDEDQDRSASSSPATSTSESATPLTSRFHTIPLETPSTAACRGNPENPENPYPTENMHNSQRCYIPFGYTKLPHFHPPRFSRRLREIIADRRRPVKLHLLPLHQPRNNEKQGWIITSPDSALLPTPKNRFLAWWDSFDPRIVVFISLVTIMLGVIVIVLAVAGYWR